MRPRAWVDWTRRLVWGRLPVAVLATSLTACTAFDYRGPDSPAPHTQAPVLTPTPRVALVLGSGGPRGYAHLGVIKVLEEAGVSVDVVVGSSVGAVVGALWAAGHNAERLAAIADSGGPLTLFDPSLFADRGWIHGQRLQDYVNHRLDHAPLEALPRRLLVVATRRADKQPVVFAQGNTGVAVRASSAVPGVISPVGIQGVEYEDADVSLPLAVQVARQAGAQFIIAVDVSARPGKAPPGTSASALERDAGRRARIDPQVSLADVLIHPDMAYDAGPRASYFVQARRAGEAEARLMLPIILDKLTHKVPPHQH